MPNCYNTGTLWNDIAKALKENWTVHTYQYFRAVSNEVTADSSPCSANVCKLHVPYWSVGMLETSWRLPAGNHMDVWKLSAVYRRISCGRGSLVTRPRGRPFSTKRPCFPGVNHLKENADAAASELQDLTVWKGERVATDIHCARKTAIMRSYAWPLHTSGDSDITIKWLTAQVISLLMQAIPFQGRRRLLRSGGLSLYRAAGSHLRMVRPSLMLVKLVAKPAAKFWT